MTLCFIFGFFVIHNRAGKFLKEISGTSEQTIWFLIESREPRRPSTKIALNGVEPFFHTQCQITSVKYMSYYVDQPECSVVHFIYSSDSK